MRCTRRRQEPLDLSLGLQRCQRAAVARGEVFAISRRGQICAELRAPAAAIGDAKSAVAGAFAQLAAVREKLDLLGEIKVIAREGLD